MIQSDFLIAAKLIHHVPDIVFKALHVLFVRSAVDDVEEDARGRFYSDFRLLYPNCDNILLFLNTLTFSFYYNNTVL